MAAAPSKVLTNLLEITILTYMLNTELWDKDAAQCVAHVIKYLLLNDEMYPLFDPAKKTSHMVQWRITFSVAHTSTILRARLRQRSHSGAPSTTS